MKKTILLTVALLCAVIFVQAQEKDFSWGYKVGVNAAAVTSNQSLGITLLAGGFFVEKGVTKFFFISADILASGQNDGEDGSTTYINFPILANYYLFNTIAIKVGIQPGIRLDSNRIQDFAIPVGIAWQGEIIIVDFRYNIGMSNIVNDYSGFNVKNRVFALTIGRRF